VAGGERGESPGTRKPLFPSLYADSGGTEGSAKVYYENVYYETMYADPTVFGL